MKKSTKSLNRKPFMMLLVLLTAVVFLASGCKGPTTQTPAGDEGQQAADQQQAAQEKGEEPPKPLGEGVEQTELPIIRETELGEGDTSFSFEVVFKDGTSHFYKISTNEKTVGSALVALGLIEGTHGSPGLFINTVDGETLNFEEDKLYWAFYERGNYAQAGIDQTDIVAGALYQLKAE